MANEPKLPICEKLRGGRHWITSVDVHEAADVIEDMYEALALAVDLVERDVIMVRPSEREELIAALTEWNLALSKARGE
jgi:hypothetical protein